MSKTIIQDFQNLCSLFFTTTFIIQPKKLGLDIAAYTSKKLSDISEEDAEEFCNMYSSWYMVKKGVLLGRIIGQTLSAEQIPSCYVNAIRKAQEVSQNA